MARNYYRTREYPFRRQDTGFGSYDPALAGTHGQKYYDYGQGKTRTNESFDTQFPYFFRKSSGYVVRRAPRATPGYGPSAFDGSIPNFGLNADKYHPYLSKARNQAWSKFVDRARGDSADLGVMLGEGKEAFNMVADRMIGLRKSYKALRRGDFRRFLRELSVDPKRKHRSKIRSTAAEASGLWLEYWFGWKPFTQGIFDALGVVTGPGTSGRRRVHGVAKVIVPFASKQTGSNSDNYCRVMSFEGVGFVKQGATVFVESENLLLLNKLGLINPAAVAWELVPFSFVVDWFTRAGDVINGWTDLVGVGVERPYSTFYLKGTVRGEYGRRSLDGPGPNIAVLEWRAGSGTRYDSLSSPVATVPRLLNYGNSQTRAATAASLLTQLFLAK